MVFCRKNLTKVKPLQIPEIEAIPVVTRSKSKYFRKKAKPKLRILDNYGAGDCLFNCFVQAVKSMNEHVSVKSLRDSVASEMNEDTFKTLKLIYDTAFDDRDYDLLSDYQWMYKVDSVEDLKNKIKSRDYFGDEMALPILEKFTGINATVVKNGKVQKRLDDKQDTGMHLVLVLKNVHYRIVSMDDVLVFRSVPKEVVHFACKNS